MAPWSRSVSWFFAGLVAGALVGFFALRLFRPRRRYFAACEYWVYLPGVASPSQEAVMSRMVRDSPYAPAIGPREGMMFSDIRLHVALVLRSKNPHVFRPDLFGSHIEPSAEQLSALADSNSIYKARFISEEPLKDDRHLQFLPHMAAAAADLADGRIVFDTVAERLFTPQWLHERLLEDGNAARPDLHVRVVWTSAGASGQAETRGLVKVGLPELVTEPAAADQRVVLASVLEDAALQLWNARSVPPTMRVEAYGDDFEIHISATKKGPYRARVYRAQRP